jgi:uncharacterized protein YecE (DUF72 family)
MTLDSSSTTTTTTPLPPVDAAHHPGPAAARERVERQPDPPTLIHAPSGGVIRFGTASWTDSTMTAPGVFYPNDARTAEQRLRYYASRFPLVEVDATFYALPAEKTAALWATRTPRGFVFDVKANALMTGHATETSRLPKALRDALPPELASRRRLSAEALPDELRDEVWRIFLSALEPLRKAEKLGSVLLQLPPWFGPSRQNRNVIVDAVRRLGDVHAAVELRNAKWFEGGTADRTLKLLAEHRIPFVMVDAPQGHANSVPRIVATTSPRLAVVRLHGRRAETWSMRNVSVQERFRYLYDRDQLAEWVSPIRAAAERAEEVHVLFNNCYANYGTTNALELAAMIGEALK